MNNWGLADDTTVCVVNLEHIGRMVSSQKWLTEVYFNPKKQNDSFRNSKAQKRVKVLYVKVNDNMEG